MVGLFLLIYIYSCTMEGKQYRFDISQSEQWQEHLKQHGFVVIKSALNGQEVQHANNLFWEWLEALGSGIKREDSSTWNDNNWPGSGSMGFFVSYGGCHTQASWYIRTHPKVKQAFKTIWRTEDLITSFDTFICWRPWWNKESKNCWNPYVENLHTDQNPSYKKGFHCIQGMVPLIDVHAEGAGGLQLVPNTNNDQTQNEICERYPWVKNSKSDWVQLKGNDPLISSGKLVQCKAGDLILWDSRTIHGGKINEPTPAFKEENMNKLARLVMTVTMVPRAQQSAMNRERRLNAFKSRIGLTHWPQEYNKSAFGTVAMNIDRQKIKYDWPTLTPEIQNLI